MKHKLPLNREPPGSASPGLGLQVFITVVGSSIMS